MSGKRVLSVGQCMADSGAIRVRLRTLFSSEVVSASTSDEALEKLRKQSFDLVLVNRIFDANGEEGLAFIQRLKAEQSTSETPVMLVSNYPESQAAAVKDGAVQGFGKAALTDDATAERLRPYLG